MPSSIPIPAALKALRGNPGKRKLWPEPKFARPQDVPPPPKHLTAIAKQEWKRVAAEAYRLGLLTEADTSVLAAYCQSFAHWVVAETELAKSTLIVEGSTGSPVQNPLFRVSAQAAEAMVKYAIEFGFTPAARARIARGAVSKQETSKFEGLLGGGSPSLTSN